MTYTQVGVLSGLNQMLIPSGERMCRLNSERCCRYGMTTTAVHVFSSGIEVGGVASTTSPVHWGNHFLFLLYIPIWCDIQANPICQARSGIGVEVEVLT